MLRTCRWMAVGGMLAAASVVAQTAPQPAQSAVRPTGVRPAVAQPGFAPSGAARSGVAPAKPHAVVRPVARPSMGSAVMGTSVMAVAAPRKRKSHRVEAPVVLPPMPSGPLSQLPMDQIPSTPARISFAGGLLTISAQNSPLGEILREVRSLTGASIEIPPGTGANERVVANLGPGAPRDVLVGLLNGSSFNYVMLGSTSDPTAVSSVILSAKPSAGGEVQTAANVYQNAVVSPMAQNSLPQPPRAFNRNLIAQQPPNGLATNGADAEDKDDDEAADDNADDQAQPGQAVTPGMAGAAPESEQPADPNQPNAGPKTPEQILEMLRRQQQPGAALIPGAQPPPEQ